jgi:SNF2 family DNA or RNA helicase
MLRRHADALALPTGGIGLIVADEAHRLKAAGGNATISALTAIPTPRRLLLSGTIVQNDLTEFYALANLAVPGCLGPLKAFRDNFASVIAAGRDADAPPHLVSLARERSATLAARTAPFILRRTAEVLERFLPPKVEAVVFVRLSPLQARL